MGEVCRAHDSRLGREVALKILPESFARDQDRLHRIEQEARAVTALSHPNILAIHLKISCRHQVDTWSELFAVHERAKQPVYSAPSRNSALLRPVPASHTRPPSIHVPAILFVVCPEFAAQSWLFIKEHEQMYGERNRRHGSKRGWVGVPENYPQPNPSGCEAQIHGVPYVAVETHHHQSLRRGHRCRCTASDPSKIPDAAHRNGESQHRRKRSQPSAIRRARRFNAETQPLRQQPEP